MMYLNTSDCILDCDVIAGEADRTIVFHIPGRSYHHQNYDRR